jgi:predicted secreted acid phosphatase
MLSPILEVCQKPKAVIFDIDGVICDSSKRFQRLDMDAWNKKNKKAFVQSLRNYNSDCAGDIPIITGISLLNYYAVDHKIFFITARGSEGYAPTQNWLKAHFPKFEENESVLIMQPEDTNNFKFSTQFDHAEYKKREAAKILEQYDVIFAIDDSDLNCRGYQSLNIPTLLFTIPNLGRVLV